MKKLILSFAVLAAMAAATSCQTSEKKAEDEGAAIKAKIENCTDADSLAIYVQQAREYADKLVKSGDDKAAQAYLDEVAPVIQSKDATAAGLFETLKSEAAAATDSVASAATEAKDKATEAVKDAADKASDAVSSTVDAGKQKAADAVQAGADKVKDLIGK